MSDSVIPPRPYEEWSTESVDRGEDAAYTFGYYLILNCRDKALKKVPDGTPKQTRDLVEQASDVALHNVLDLLEGFFKTDAGPNHPVQFALSVVVLDANGNQVEEIQISPAAHDLPIGYWKWRDRDFQ